jgi:glycosyltransferase involved in cell wall biosynthesis
MRVVINANVPASGFGGVQTYLGALIKALGELVDGNEEYVLLSSIENAKWLQPLCGPNQRLEIVEYVATGWCRRGLNRLHRFAAQISAAVPTMRNGGMNHIKPTPDLTKSLSTSISTGVIESLGASVIHFPFQQYIVSGLPSVFNPHDLQHLSLPHFFSPEAIAEREHHYPLACRMATIVAVASEWVANDICERYSISRKKVAVVPWGAATSMCLAPTEEQIELVTKRYDLPEEFLFYPAVTWPHKNHLRLIEALGRLNRMETGVHLVLSGAKTPLFAEIEGLASRLGVSHLVRHIGHIAQEDLRAVYRSASAVVIPTLYEAVSGPMADAWFDNVPVVCSDIPQLRGQAGEMAALFFDPHSPELMAAAIAKMLGDPRTRQECIAAGQEKLTALSWTATAEGYRELYRNAATFVS